MLARLDRFHVRMFSAGRGSFPITPLAREQSGSLNAGTCITILPEGPHYLEQQAIPRAAIPNCTNHFSVVNTLGESELDSACSMEGFQLFGGEFQIQTGEIVLELRYLPSSNNRDHWHRLIPQPGERDLRHAATGLFRDRLYRRDNPRRALLLGKESFIPRWTSAHRQFCLHRDTSRSEHHSPAETKPKRPGSKLSP